MSILAKVENAHYLKIEGSLDALAVEILRPRFDTLVQEEHDVTIDMSEINFIDSSGIGAIVFLFKRLRALGRKLCLNGVHGQPLELLKHLRIDQSIQVNE
ncbi:STAS domain-containing protein [Neptunomonas sp. XY-337]|uniref:STAS domain-containing protein n=1 Tax=Neptunomonas sp. XY-337 TaxID=2561897 RepID=UPI0010AA0FA2|nr:STAS domain-containing protein [Neptunomonas sp. XY-337]